MNPASFLERLGFEGGRGDAAFAWRITGAILLVYALGFALWWPSVPTNTDEAMFVNQTKLLLEGKTKAEKVDPLTGETFLFIKQPYPNGLPALLAPFMWIGGARAAYLVPLLSVITAVLLLGRWLAEEGRSPVFALVALVFVPTLAMGRVLMSDAPSLALVTFGIWLFWRGLDGGWPWWLASGFVAGASMTVRFTNCLPFVTFYAGAVLRRELRASALLIGGLAGVGVRLFASYLQFGDPLHERGFYPLALESIGERLPLYLFGLLVLVPGGLLAASLYRGRRRPELICGVWFYFAFYLFQEFSTNTTGLSKRVVLALRYFMELLPLLVMALAEVTPRVWRAVAARTGSARIWVARAAAAGLAAGLVAAAGASFAVHAYLGRWSSSQATIAGAIHRHTGDDSVLITNRAATEKFLRMVERRYRNLNSMETTQAQVAELLRRHDAVFIALLDRSDSGYWRKRAERNQAFVDSLEPVPRLIYDEQITPTDRLRIWRLGNGER